MSVSAHRSNDSFITVDGSEFRWRVHREPQWCTADGWKGLSICIELAEGSPHRQLLLQYPFEVKERGSTPHRQRPQISEARLTANIRQAVAAGWKPDSRGKPFVFDVPED
jgi:hypothetical protein